eukprot:scaffold5621_cov121-Chaetoceros_neogracile.AAC.1
MKHTTATATSTTTRAEHDRNGHGKSSSCFHPMFIQANDSLALTISGRTRMPDIISNDSMQRRRMAMAARNTGHSDFTMMPSTIQQNSHPAFVIDNFAYYWPQHQKEALLVMRSRPF